jgi:hypothetical protein
LARLVSVARNFFNAFVGKTAPADADSTAYDAGSGSRPRFAPIRPSNPVQGLPVDSAATLPRVSSKRRAGRRARGAPASLALDR